VALWPWLNALLCALELPPVTRAVPLRVARLAASGCEAWWRITRRAGEPPLSRFLASALARSHWYDPRPAEQDLGSRARVPGAEARRRTIEWLQGTLAPPPGASAPSRTRPAILSRGEAR
jgi:hypothetical protein